MADITTIAELGTAGGTLILAIATFGATRSANRSARIAERSMLIGMRPTLVPSRPEDRTERVDFAAGGGSRSFELPGGTALVAQEGGVSLFAISLRNVGTGAALIEGWYMRRGFLTADVPHSDPDQFQSQRRDLYISPGDTGFWQGAIRDPSDPFHEVVREAIAETRLAGRRAALQRPGRRAALRIPLLAAAGGRPLVSGGGTPLDAGFLSQPRRW